MSRAIFLAHRCAETGDVPVGALVLNREGQIVGEGRNRREADGDPTAHAEILALREAGKRLGTWNLSGYTLVVTLEPCTMCAGAAVMARVERIVFGAWDEQAGACGSLRDVARDARLNHQIEVVAGVMEDEASIQLKGFFAQKRMEKEQQQSAFWQRRPAPVPAAAENYRETPEKPELPELVRRRRSDQHRHRIFVPPLSDD